MAAFEAGPQTWLPTHIVREGGQMGTELVLNVNGHTIARDATVETGAPVDLSGRLLLPIIWRLTQQEKLFPVLEGQLEVTLTGPGTTQLALGANYTSPG